MERRKEKENKRSLTYFSFTALLFSEKRISEETEEDKTDSSWLISHENGKHTQRKKEIECEEVHAYVSIKYLYKRDMEKYLNCTHNITLNATTSNSVTNQRVELHICFVLPNRVQLLPVAL